ncbi:MAG: argininosuccinate synthase [Chloroflexota bacterium]|nr:argininosuccinate synthase [Chloroflexota bacterium]
MLKKVVLAYSGGVDTSVAIKWLIEKYSVEVVALTVDVGNERDFTSIKEKALQLGASDALVADAKETFVSDYLFPALQANALYQDTYPLATALSRPLIAKLLVDMARAKGADAVVHGCTGKGNDQVRIEIGLATLAPDLQIIAPAREWGMTREQTIAYARDHDIPIPVSSSSPYSIDENLWGRSIECGVLEDPWVEPPDDVFIWTKTSGGTTQKPAYVEIDFKHGIPVALDGKKMSGIDLIQRLSDLAGKYGIGRIDHIEDRLIGIKSREIYEAPAADVLLRAHRALESMTLSRDQLRFKQRVSDEYADLIYDGMWFSALCSDLRAYVLSSQRYVTGTIRLKLTNGNCRVVGRKSPHALYRHELATYDEGDQFDQSDAPGFIRLLGLPSKTQAQVQHGE